MPVTPTYPGVYVQEVPSGVRTIVGVATSITMFIGMTKKGPINDPIQCLNYGDFVRTFSEDTSVGNLPFYVRMFFLNGGTNCYVMRVAKGSVQSAVTLLNDPVPPAAQKPALTLTARDGGKTGDLIRAQVSYASQYPEAYFNLDVFTYQTDSSGKLVKTGTESWKNLSMSPGSPLYAADFVTQNSKLVVATLPGGGAAATNGFSMSGRAVSNGGGFTNNWKTQLGSLVNTNRFQISVAGSPYVEVDLKPIVVTTEAVLATAIQTAIQNAFTAAGILGITVNIDFSSFAPPAMKRMVIQSTLPAPFGDVFIRPGSQNDLAVQLMLGTAQGGIEVSGYASLRPAPTGISFRANDPAAVNAFANVNQQALNLSLESFNADGTTNTEVVPLNFVTAGAKMYQDGFGAASLNGNSDGIREKFAIAMQAINTFAPAPGRVFPWIAEVAGSRLTIKPTTTNDNFLSGIFAVAPDTTLQTNSMNNVQLYQLGTGGTNGAQGGGTAGNDGSAPDAATYDGAYKIIDKEVDLFNLMVLTPDASVSMNKIYPNASIFCQQRRAFLLMDPPTTWDGSQKAAADVANQRLGLVKDYSAIFFPRITVDDRGKNVNIGPTGAIAGLCARIDGTRGVWKAPAGTEADLRGVLGLEYRLSDPENGVTNPRAVNTLRIFPEGIVNWGARTNDGDDNFGSEYKYIPIRRLALYIEESLYRGLKWVVFEPNDEPLWAQIRLNVGAFMHNLFRQGAFQGQTPKDAYFVKCDSETTTQNDRNLGVVNIWVGFAPLKPAEFVILYLQQMAGQIQV